jgi:hypothetical protein
MMVRGTQEGAEHVVEGFCELLFSHRLLAGDGDGKLREAVGDVE